MLSMLVSMSVLDAERLYGILVSAFDQGNKAFVVKPGTVFEVSSRHPDAEVKFPPRPQVSPNNWPSASPTDTFPRARPTTKLFIHNLHLLPHSNIDIFSIFCYYKLTYHKNKKMSTIERAIDREEDKAIRENIAGSIKVAGSALPYLAARGYTNLTNDVNSRRYPSVAKSMINVCLALPNTISQLNGKGYDASISSAMHGYMGDIIEYSENTGLTKHALINACVAFCKNNGLVLNGNLIKALEEQIGSDITGVWSERSWENLFVASGIFAERASIGEDLGGTDLWIPIGEDNSGRWVSVDVKAQPRTIDLHAQKKGREILYSNSLPCPSHAFPDFSLRVVITSDIHSAYIAFDNPPGGGGLAPIDFRGHSSAIDQMPDLMNILRFSANQGRLITYRSVEANDGNLHFKPNRRIGK